MNELRPDPRIYFAAERTLLAWIRTGLTIVGLGFVVARFGLFLQLISRQGEVPPQTQTISTLIGVGAVIFGTLAMAIAAWQHGHFISSLEHIETPTNYFIRWPIYFASALSVLGLMLGAYLLFGSSTAGVANIQ